jgi:NAD(P)H dehydrogenase (quinone)
VRPGTNDQPESLAKAYAGLDRLLIITTVAPEPGKRGAQNVAAIDAAVNAGVKHIVFMSAVGTRQEEELAQAALKQGVLAGLAENRAAFVAREDVAAAAAGILIGEGHAGAIYNATGPERLSGAERADVIGDIAGRSLAFRVTTEAQLRAGLTQASLPAARCACRGAENSISVKTSSARGDESASGAHDTAGGSVIAGFAPVSARLFSFM